MYFCVRVSESFKVCFWQDQGLRDLEATTGALRCKALKALAIADLALTRVTPPPVSPCSLLLINGPINPKQESLVQQRPPVTINGPLVSIRCPLPPSPLWALCGPPFDPPSLNLPRLKALEGILGYMPSTTMLSGLLLERVGFTGPTCNHSAPGGRQAGASCTCVGYILPEVEEMFRSGSGFGYSSGRWGLLVVAGDVSCVPNTLCEWRCEAAIETIFSAWFGIYHLPHFTPVSCEK